MTNKKQIKIARFKSLQALIIIPFVIIIVAAVSLSGYLSFRAGQTSVNDLAQQLMREISTKINIHLHHYMTTPHLITESNAQLFKRKTLIVENVDDIESHFFEQLKQFNVQGIFFGNQEGRGVAVFQDGPHSFQSRIISDPPHRFFYRLDQQGHRVSAIKNEDWDPRTRPWYTGAVSSKQSIWSPVYTFTDGVLGITASKPYEDAQGKKVGVIGVDLDLSFIGQFLNQLKIGKTGKAFIIDQEGYLLASSFPTPLFSKTENSDTLTRISGLDNANPLIRTVMQRLQKRSKRLEKEENNDQFMLDSGDQTFFVNVSSFDTGSNLKFTVVITIPESDLMGEINRNKTETIVLTMGLLLLCILLGYLIARIILRPVQALSQASNRIANGDFTQKIGLDSSNELGILASAFDLMTDELQESFNNLEEMNWNLEQRVEERTKELAASGERFRLITQSVHDAIVSFTLDGLIRFWNTGAQTIFGYEESEIIQQPIFQLLQEQQRDNSAQIRMIMRSSLKNDGKNFELMGLKKNSQEFSMEVSLSSWTDDGVKFIVAVIRDITERRLSEEKIRYQANFDALTALPNRSYFTTLLASAISMAQRHKFKVALMFIDLDRFKWVNDNLGHAAGDLLLIEVAKRLKAVLRLNDTVARLGGDEFTVIAQSITSADQARMVADKILEQLNTPFYLDGQKAQISGSIGITLFPDDADSSETLLKNADQAMYTVKEAGRGDIQFYTDKMHQDSIRRMRLVKDLENAIKNEEFILYYQPKVNLKQGKIIGMEALVRWEKPGEGIIPPDEFIPLSEETGLIKMVGAYVLETACRENQRWIDAGFGPLKVAVNISPRQFQDGEKLIQMIEDALEKTHLSPHYLELEITESMMMVNVGQAVEIMNKIKDMGVSMSIDDFGTGYSSLGSLKNFPISALKIDKSFVMDITKNTDDAAIVSAIISMAKQLNIEVIAEGVEKVEHVTFLTKAGCTDIQGYYYSPPLSVVQFEELLNNPRSLVV